MSLMNLGLRTEIDSLQKQVAHERNRRFWNEAESYSETFLLGSLPSKTFLVCQQNSENSYQLHPIGKEAQLNIYKFHLFLT